MEIYLIRHGESEGNVRNWVTGDHTVPLTRRGREQAIRLSRVIGELGVRFDRAYVSHMLRAQETADLSMSGQPFEICPEIAETDGGDASFMTMVEFLKQYPDFYEKFDPYRPYPNGESHQDLYDRTVRWFEEVVVRQRREGEKVVISAHAGTVACLLHALLGVPMCEFPRFLAPNASLTKLTLEEGRGAILRLFGVTG